MPEVMFVIKSLVVTVLIVLVMQIKMGPATVEDHVQDWLRTSSVTHQLRDVAGGASLAIHNAAKMISNYASEKFGGGRTVAEKLQQKDEEKAGRLNFDFKRSSAYEKQHSN